MITTHILDTAAGRPAAGVKVQLEIAHPSGASWLLLGTALTDSGGRIGSFPGLPQSGLLTPAHYRLSFATHAYFAERAQSSFFPQVVIEFAVTAEREHYHVPLLISPFAYSTYRGS